MNQSNDKSPVSELKKRKIDEGETTYLAKKPMRSITPKNVQSLLSDKGITIEMKPPASPKPLKPSRITSTAKNKIYKNPKILKCAKKVILTREMLVPKKKATAEIENDISQVEHAPRKVTKEMFPDMKIIGQFNLGFILTTLEDDLFVIDQHASDKKYNFEDLSKNTVIQTQALVCPQQIRLSSINESIVIQNLNIFEKNGFKFNVFHDAPATQRLHLTSRPYSKGVCYLLLFHIHSESL